MNTVKLDSDTTLTLHSEAHAAANLLKAAGDTLRLQILNILSSGSFGVMELCILFDTKQSSMSHHLKVLAKANLVSTRREGNSIFYTRCDQNMPTQIDTLRHAIFLHVESLPVSDTVNQHLSDVFKQRSQTSLLFFQEHTDDFVTQQERIAEYNIYGPEVIKLLDQCTLINNNDSLEVGPGFGEFLAPLSQRFKSVTALDNAAPMLSRCQTHCNALNINNIEYICADTRACQDWYQRFSLAVINMVLHHSASPKDIFQDVSHSLLPGGSLIICDLDAHNQDWVRKACGDMWLGFHTHELKSWGVLAGLTLHESRYVSLRNGFQIQIHQFLKGN